MNCLSTRSLSRSKRCWWFSSRSDLNILSNLIKWDGTTNINIVLSTSLYNDGDVFNQSMKRAESYRFSVGICEADVSSICFRDLQWTSTKNILPYPRNAWNLYCRIYSLHSQIQKKPFNPKPGLPVRESTPETLGNRRFSCTNCSKLLFSLCSGWHRWQTKKPFFQVSLPPGSPQHPPDPGLTVAVNAQLVSTSLCWSRDTKLGAPKNSGLTPNWYKRH